MNNIDDKLAKLAKEAGEKAYAPYSNFRVGAALITDSGNIYTGCNIENAAYPATVCGEDVAVFKAISEGYTKFKAMSISTENAGMPCGACRQVIWELCGDIPLYICDEKKLVSTNNSKDLIPDPFDKTKLL